MYRLKQCYSSCGDEYRINCYHLTTASDAATAYNEQLVNRRKYQQEEREKEAKLKELEEIKTMTWEEFEKNEQMREDNKIEKDKIEFENMMDYDPEMDAASYT
jgi:coproporphyrinogen III oxidase-like Fe-S oxidoreductase